MRPDAQASVRTRNSANEVPDAVAVELEQRDDPLSDDEQPSVPNHPRGTHARRAGQHFNWRQHLALELENTGSVARDHLASERTWLAYVRTSLAIASAGVALVQLFTLNNNSTDRNVLHFARPLGALSVSLGLLILIVGFWRYFDVQSALTHGKFSPAKWTVTLLSSLLAINIAVIFGFLVSSRKLG